MPPDIDFHTMLGSILIQSAYNGLKPDGAWRFGPPEKDKDGRRRFVVPERALGDATVYRQLAPLFPAFARCHGEFADAESARIAAILVAHMILGPERVALPITRADYDQAMRELEPLMLKAGTYAVRALNLVLDLYDLHPADMPVRVHTTRSALLAHFFLGQYDFKREGCERVGVDPGDTVVEGGMCYGDTALHFAHQAGENGRVVGYEFEPDNLKILEENLRLNPDLSRRIRVLHRATAAASDAELTFAMAGPATQVLEEGATSAAPVMRVKTLSIDDLVKREKLERVDFIKLDVEGMELETLAGAADTLRRFRPKLALSAYHRLDDIPELMRHLRSLDLGYRFWLNHYRPHRQETVLFAKSG